jgi:hypothetical protein
MAAPWEWGEAVSHLRLPLRANTRLPHPVTRAETRGAGRADPRIAGPHGPGHQQCQRGDAELNGRGAARWAQGSLWTTGEGAKGSEGGRGVAEGDLRRGSTTALRSPTRVPEAWRRARQRPRGGSPREGWCGWP